jgi:signal transduction histidine kinase/streptogramin lyase
VNKAAKKLFRKLLKGLRYIPHAIITDRPTSYHAAIAEELLGVANLQQKYQHNRAEHSPQPTRWRERLMRRLQSAGHAQRFLSAFGTIADFLAENYANHLLVAAVVVLLCFSCVARVEGQYRFDHWTTDNGLPQNSVCGITQTLDGYLWLATVDGLVRFDGLRFTVFDQSNSKGLKSNRFINLHQDIAGALWAGTEDGGLTRYREGQFTTFTTADGLPDNQVTKVEDDPEGGLLILTAKGWARYRDGKFSAYPEPGDWMTLQIYLGPSGARWVLDKTGLTRTQKGQKTKYILPLGKDEYINTVYEDRDGSLWLSSVGFAVFRVANGAITRYSAKDGLPAGHRITTIYQESDGGIWFGTEGAGLVRFKGGHFTPFTMANDPAGRVLSIFEDRERTLWVGSATGGLSRLTRQFITAYSNKEGLASNTVYPLLEDRADNVWLGTTVGLSRFSKGVFTNYDGKKALAGMLDDLQALFEDREGRLWMSNTVATVYLKDGKVTAPPEIAGKFAGCVAIYEDGQGNLWFGARDGLFKLKDHVLSAYTSKDGLPGDDVKIIYEHRQSNLWIGTYGGLAELTIGAHSTPTFISYTTKEGLGSNRVRALHEDADGVLWIGTYDGGLSRLKNGRITTYTMAQGLFNNGVFQILEDGRGNLWISCNRGIYRVSKQQLNDFADGKISALTCIAYGKDDGMLNTECNGGRQPAGFKARDGKLWFPTMGGVVVIDTGAVPFNTEPPPVLIEGVSLDSKPMDSQAGVQVRPGQSSLEINYTGLSYVKPEQVRFKYQLIGQDKTWVDAGTRRSVNYSYLPPGNYTFTVIAANSDGVWNTVGASLQIKVLPPVWRTWWFISLAVLTVVGLVLFVYWRRISQFHREKVAQEAFSQRLIESQEGERKRLAAELHDSLSQNLVIIKNRALHSLTTPNDHDRAIEQIEEIAEAATQSLSEVREIAHNLRPFQIDRLGLTKAIDAMVKRVAGSQLVRTTAHLDVIDGLLAPEIEIHLYRIVQESLNNIIKHAAATEAQVIIRKTKKAIDITIQDNGKGFSPATGGKDETSTGSGFGLLGLAERVRILKGTWTIESAPANGTVIAVKLPCEPKG